MGTSDNGVRLSPTDELSAAPSSVEEYLRSGDVVRAEELCTKALASDPSSTAAWHNLGVIASNRGQFDIAIAHTQKAINLLEARPVHQQESQKLSEAYRNLGNIFVRMGKLDEALQAFTSSSKLGLNDWTLHINFGVLYMQMGSPIEAIASFEEAFKTVPREQIQELTSDLGYAYLMKGELTKGLHLVSHKWSNPTKEIEDLGIPIWDFRSNPDLREKHIVVCSNQGLGDAIQFLRFFPSLIFNLSKLGSTLTFSVPKALIRLLYSHPYFQSVTMVEEGLLRTRSRPAYYLPLSQIPLWAKASYEDIPNSTYLYVGEPRSFRQEGGPLRVGLVWSSRKGHDTSHHRSIPLRDLLPLTTIPNVEVYGLQVLPASSEIYKVGAQHLIRDLSGKISDLYDLARFMSKMDVIVSADTGPLHLAGAMGLLCFGLLSRCGADWRWQGHTHQSTPWYPSLRFFRQDIPGDWSKVVQQARSVLTALSNSEDSKSLKDCMSRFNNLERFTGLPTSTSTSTSTSTPVP